MGERRNLVSARVPSRSARAILSNGGMILTEKMRSTLTSRPNATLSTTNPTRTAFVVEECRTGIICCLNASYCPANHHSIAVPCSFIYTSANMDNRQLEVKVQQKYSLTSAHEITNRHRPRNGSCIAVSYLWHTSDNYCMEFLLLYRAF